MIYFTKSYSQRPEVVSFRKNNVNKPKNFFHFLGHHPLTEEQFDTIFPDLFMLKG